MSKTQEPRFRVMDIIRGTTVDGPGFRTSIYLAGCGHQCPGCHNPSSWSPENGEEVTLSEIIQIIEEEDFDVTISGGDPLFYPEKLHLLIKEIKKNRRNIWVYTGYTWEEILSSQKLLNAVKEADVVIDGRYIEDQRNTDLPFRGSANQRIIEIKESLKHHNVVFHSSMAFSSFASSAGASLPSSD